MARVILQRVWNPSKLLHNTPKRADAFLLAELDCGIHLKANNYLVKSECVIQLLKNKHQEEGRKFWGGLMDNVRGNWGQNYKRTQPKWRLEAQSSGRWRWLLPGDPFHPWKSNPVHKNDVCGLALKGGARWMALFWGVLSTCLKTSHETSQLCHGRHARSWRFLCLSVANSWFFIPDRIWHCVVQQRGGLWPIPNLWWRFSPSSETFSLRFLLPLTNKHLVWHF